MGVFKNDVGRPSNKTIIIRNILKGILVIVLAAAIFAGGYFLNGNKKSATGSNKNTKNETTRLSSNEKMSIKDGEKILYGIFDNFYYFSPEVYNSDEFKTYVAITKTKPKKKNYTCKELFGNDLKPWGSNPNGNLWTAYTDGNFGLLCADEDDTFYMYEDVDITYKKLFGENNLALKEFVSYGLVENYGYSSNKNVYMSLSCECGDGGFNPIYGVTSVKKEGNKVYIDFVYSFAEYVDKDNNLLELANKETIKLTDSEVNNKETYKKYADKLNKVTFIFEMKDNNYIFVKVN